MASRRVLEDEEIVSILNQEDEFSNDGSDSEIEDHVIEDDVQSETDDEYVDEVIEENLDETSTSEHRGHDHRIIIPAQRVIRGKNRHVWATCKGQNHGRTSAINIVRSNRGPTRMYRNILDPLLCFHLFITDDIIQELVRWTNVEISIKRSDSMTSPTFRDTNPTELKAFIGILTLSAAMKDNHLSTVELFDSSFSGTRYVTVMSRDRFDFIIRCLRMDDKTLRPAHRKQDPFIPVRKVWDLFIAQCKSNYSPGSNVTVDEQLLGFRGRCPFRMYIPNKPSKYGIKIPMMCDSGTSYMLNAMPYIGRATNTNGLPQGEYYLKELSRPVHGTNRNITCDNWFTSIPATKSMLLAPYKLTIVGTVRSNKREIPEQLKNTRSRQVGTSMFAFDGYLTLVSYKPKPSKMVYLLSSCDEGPIINSSTGKPEMIMFYNQTKGGVDTFDQMCSSMSCSRKTNRWPMTMFYGILNIAFVNSYIIYTHNVLLNGGRRLNRREYMKKLSSDLSAPWMRSRMEVPTLTRRLKENIQKILPQTSQEGSEEADDEPPAKIGTVLDDLKSPVSAPWVAVVDQKSHLIQCAKNQNGQGHPLNQLQQPQQHLPEQHQKLIEKLQLQIRELQQQHKEQQQERPSI
ncbi:piggyBac transposable element-derived protein 4-like [Eupeodes corollae]|uniref:piggyBac transposable element-derived protein 4-like n=1 Tax=Eupeodes corollae TaxID=290404 RepID=UPI002492B2D5|nr:piggyBac transposable element-derived protein 4-like [Eupeodes corollae]